MQHMTDLRKFFNRLRKHSMRLNPAKCTFGVKRGKALGYMVIERGIEADPKKIKAIIDMKLPQTLTEVKSFMGRLQYISRFINQLTSLCEPMFKLMKKNADIKWDSECQTAFEKIKTALVWVVEKLKHYMQSHSVLLVSKMDPVRYLFDKPSLSMRLAKWSFFLAEFDIKYMVRKSTKAE